MNMNQIINMVMKIIMRKAINKGVDVGIQKASGMGRKGQGGDAPDNLQHRKQVQKSQKNAKQAMRVARRFGRM